LPVSGEKAPVFLVNLGLGFNGNLDDWIRKIHGLQDNGLLLRHTGCPSCNTFQPDSGCDVTRVDYLISSRLLACIRTTEPIRSRLLFDGIENEITRIQCTRINTEKSQLPHIRVGHDLECNCRKGSVILCFSSHCLG